MRGKHVLRSNTTRSKTNPLCTLMERCASYNTTTDLVNIRKIYYDILVHTEMTKLKDLERRINVCNTIVRRGVFKRERQLAKSTLKGLMYELAELQVSKMAMFDMETSSIIDDYHATLQEMYTRRVVYKTRSNSSSRTYEYICEFIRIFKMYTSNNASASSDTLDVTYPPPPNASSLDTTILDSNVCEGTCIYINTSDLSDYMKCANCGSLSIKDDEFINSYVDVASQCDVGGSKTEYIRSVFHKASGLYETEFTDRRLILIKVVVYVEWCKLAGVVSTPASNASSSVPDDFDDFIANMSMAVMKVVVYYISYIVNQCIKFIDDSAMCSSLANNDITQTFTDFTSLPSFIKMCRKKVQNVFPIFKRGKSKDMCNIHAHTYFFTRVTSMINANISFEDIIATIYDPSTDGESSVDSPSVDAILDYANLDDYYAIYGKLVGVNFGRIVAYKDNILDDYVIQEEAIEKCMRETGRKNSPNVWVRLWYLLSRLGVHTPRSDYYPTLNTHTAVCGCDVSGLETPVEDLIEKAWGIIGWDVSIIKKGEGKMCFI